jgi:hypothetical protein
LSQIQISIVKGEYRGNNSVSGVFPLVKGYVDGKLGGFVTIRNPNPEPGHPSVQRIKLAADAFKLLDAAGDELAAHIVVPGADMPLQGTGAPNTDFETVFMESETEEEAMERIGDTFNMLDKITDACAQGIVRGLVVSGPPGIGKSFGVEKQLAAANLFAVIKTGEPNYEVVSGGVSSIGLYQKLYFNRRPEDVIVFDDCDGVLFEEECLNLLKAALNSGDKRRICWNKESRVLGDSGIPNEFDFEGGIIFLSNIDFDRSIARGSRIASHLSAIMSRCHYLDLEIGSLRDRLLRIKQVVRDGMLKPFNFSEEQEAAVVAFTADNAEYLREVSLRMVKKIADFVKASPNGWYEMAEATCLTKDAKFKRLYERKQKAAKDVGVVLV